MTQAGTTVRDPRDPVEVRLGIRDGKHFSISPTTVEVGRRKDPNDLTDPTRNRVTWTSDHPFVVHFLARSPFDALEYWGARPLAGGPYQVTAEVRDDAERCTYEYAVGIAARVPIEGSQVEEYKVFVHVSGEVRKYP